MELLDFCKFSQTPVIRAGAQVGFRLMQKSKCGDFRNPNSKRVATLFLSQSMATTQWNSAMLWQPRMKGGFGNNEGLDAGPSVHLLFIHFLHVGFNISQ